MALAKFLLPLFFFVSIFAANCDDGHVEEEAVISSLAGPDFLYLKIELEELQTKIRLLESVAGERTRELKTKDDLIAQKDKIIQQKTDTIASIRSEISTLKKKGHVDVEEQVGKAHAQTLELENQVDRLNNELQINYAERVLLEKRIKESGEKITTLNSKIEKLEKVAQEGRTKIRKTERSLKIAEDELVKIKLESKSHALKLHEANNAWLPPWLAVRWVRVWSLIKAEWKEHGEPVIGVVMLRVTEKSAEARLWAEPHWLKFQTSVILWFREQWWLVEPQVRALVDGLIRMYESTTSAAGAQLVSFHEASDPYFQEVKRVIVPYIDGVADVAKPHVDKIRLAFKPYSRGLTRKSRRLLRSARSYHAQVQRAVRETMDRHDFTRYIATEEVVWFMAFALLASPLFLLVWLYTSLSPKKNVKKAVRSGNARRRARRNHLEKVAE